MGWVAFDGVSGHGWHFGGMGKDPMESGRGSSFLTNYS
jgi:hypothetical protein